MRDATIALSTHTDGKPDMSFPGRGATDAHGITPTSGRDAANGLTRMVKALLASWIGSSCRSTAATGTTWGGTVRG